MIGPKVPPEVQQEMAAQMESEVNFNGDPPPMMLYANLPDTLTIGERATLLNGPNYSDSAVNIPTDSTDASIELSEGSVDKLHMTRLEGGAIVFTFETPHPFRDFQIAALPIDSSSEGMVVLGPERDIQGRAWFKEKVSEGLHELGLKIEPDALLYRAVPRYLQLSLQSSLQAGLEAQVFGTERSREDSIIPHLIDFYERNNKLEMHFTFNGKVHHVSGIINQRSKEKFEVELTGPNSDRAGLDQMRSSIREILRVKMPELGYPDVQYRGLGNEVALLPTLKEFTEQPGGEHFTLTYGIGEDREFDITIYRNAAYDNGTDDMLPSLYVSGPRHGKISDEWVRLRGAREFAKQRPDLHYNGAALSTW